MLKNTKRTKIVCTLGPASEKEEVLTSLIENGLNVARMNFSHGSHEEHKGRMDLVKKVREKLNKPVVFVANIPASAGNEADDLACDTPYWRILHMDDINTAYKRVTSSRNLPFISMYDLFLDYCAKNATPLDSLLCDGLHPNDAGYRVMFDLIRDALQV